MPKSDSARVRRLRDQIAQRALRRARVTFASAMRREDSREQEERGDKRESESSKMPPRDAQNEPKKAQNGARSDPRRPQEELRRAKKANPNRKTKKEPNQDDPKTVLDPPGARFPSIHALPGAHLRAQIGTKTDPKTIKHRSNKSRGKNKRSKTILDPSWSDLGPFWGAILGEKKPQTIGKHTVS